MRIEPKLFIAALLFAFVVPFLAHAEITARDVLIKGPGRGAAVYYLANDGKRYVFPSQKVYNSWFSDFSGVIEVQPADLAAFRLGGNVTYRPGIRMVKITTDPKVYAVDGNGSLRWVTSESAAISLYGDDWNQKIDDVPDAFFFDYHMGAPIASYADFSPAAAARAATTINADKSLSVSLNPRPADTVPPTGNAAPAQMTGEAPAASDPALVGYAIGSGVSQGDDTVIRSSIDMADKRLKQWFGRSLNAKATVHVSAEPSTQGCCEVGADANGLAIYLRTADNDWAQAAFAALLFTDLRQQLPAHEYVHIYQGQNGCGLQHQPVQLRWLMEGMAEWLSFRMLSEDGIVTDAAWHSHLLQRMKLSAPVGPLSEYESDHKGVDYATFALAVDRLMSGKPITALDSFCTALGSGLGGAAAFEKAFGVPLSAFYADFATYRAGL